MDFVESSRGKGKIKGDILFFDWSRQIPLIHGNRRHSRCGEFLWRHHVPTRDQAVCESNYGSSRTRSMWFAWPRLIVIRNGVLFGFV
jgi:hypothetical protein